MNGAILAALAAAGLVVTPARAQPQESTSPPPRPKVVLVLSGGGARGAAHLGVLKTLEDYRVPVDMIVGTSMGAIVGGLYAAGWSVEEIEAKLTKTDWSSVFVDRLPRRYRTFRRKTDDARFLVPLKMRFKNWRPYLPPALLGGQSLELLVKGLELEATGERDFDRFPIAFRAVASDLATGEMVVLGRGSLAEAMQASMALPGVFPPVEIEGKALADGGIAANFPIRVARDFGADVVIGVDISSPLRPKEELGNILTRLDQVTSLITNAHKNEDLAALRPDDVVMTPDLADITFSDFARAGEAIAAGEAAARAHETELRRLAVGDGAWAAYRERHRRVGASDRVVDEVRITNTGPLSDAIVAKRIDVSVGAPLDEAKLAGELLGLYSLDAFGPIRHDLRREDGRSVLTIDTPKKPYGRNSLQFGFSLNDNFQGDTGFNVAVSHLFNPINRRGGEWRNVIQLGENEIVATEFYQPIDSGMSWFVEPKLELRRDTLRRYDETGHALAEFRVRSRRAQVGFGRVLGRWGAAGLGAFRTVDEGRLRIGVGFDPVPRAADGGVFATFRVDTLDSPIWPQDGTRVEVSCLRSIDSLGADRAGSNVHAEAGQVLSFGKNVVLGSVEAGTSFNGLPSLTNAFRLGGFLRLSGLAQDELLGRDGGLMRFLYFRELTRFNLGSITQRMYAGVSFEAGNVYNDGDSVTWASLRRAGSIYAGADTVIGPAYLGIGFAEGGRTSFFLIIGQRF